MATIASRVTIDRSPEDVWAVLGDLAAVTDWVPGVASADVDGPRRVCTLADGAVIREEIYDYSRERRSFSYAQTSHPLGFKSSRGTLAVTDEGPAATVVWTAEIEFAEDGQEAQFLPLLEQGYAAALQALKTAVER